MIETHSYSVLVTPAQQAVLKRLLVDLAFTRQADSIELLGSRLYFKVRAGDPRLGRLRDALSSMRPPLALDRYSVDVEYEVAELEQAEYVTMHLARQGKGDTGLAYGTEYDLTKGCQVCGTGSPQVSALRIQASALSKSARIVTSDRGAILLASDLAVGLANLLHGASCLRRVEDRRTKRELPWWQMLPIASMPPADTSSELTIGDQQCPRCKRDHFGGPVDGRPIVYAYRMDTADRKRLPDCVSTWEHFGKSRLAPQHPFLPTLAVPDLLVTNRVMQLFLKHQIPALKFVPVRFL